MEKRYNSSKRPASMLSSGRRSPSAPPVNFGRRAPAVFDSTDLNNHQSIIPEGVNLVISRSNHPNLPPPPSTTHSTDEFRQIEHVECDEVEEIPSTGKTNLIWNTKMEDVLIDSLLEQKLLGQKIGTSFTKTAYKAVARAVSVKCKVNCLSIHVVNRLKTVKKSYAIIHDMMASTSGFGYNQSTQMVENLEPVWDVKMRPKAAKYRYAPIRNYEKLLDLFGKDRLTGSHAFGPKQRRRRVDKEQISPNIDIIDDLNNFEFEIGADSSCLNNTHNMKSKNDHNANISSASKHSLRSKKKKFRMSDVLREEFLSMRDGMDKVAESLDRGNIRNYDDEYLYSEIEKVHGMSEIFVMKVYQELSIDVPRAQSFLSCRNDKRKFWLQVRFGNSFLRNENVERDFNSNNYD